MPYAAMVAYARGSPVAPTCALCGMRDSVTTTEWDGRRVHACGPCLMEARTEHAAPSTEAISVRVYGVVTGHDGLTLRQVLAALGIEVYPGHARECSRYNAVMQALSRGVARGVIGSRILGGKRRLRVYLPGHQAD